MNTEMKKIVIFLGVFFLGFVIKAQDASFTQYNESKLYLNPSYASNERFTELSLNYRTQWRSLSSSYQTTQLSFIHPIYTNDVKKRRVAGIGVSLFNDQAGTAQVRTLGASVSGSKLLRITRDYKHIVSLGLQAGFVHKRLSFDDLELAEQYEEFVGFNSNITPADFASGSTPSRTFLDLAAGFLYSYNNTQAYNRGELSGYFGAAVGHLNAPNESLFDADKSKLSRNVRFNGGVTLPLGNFIYIEPSVLIQNQGESSTVNLNANIAYNLRYGSHNKYLDKMIAFAGLGTRLEEANYVKVGLSSRALGLFYSYDLTSSGLSDSNVRVGASEISLVIKNPVNTIRHADTPRR